MSVASDSKLLSEKQLSKEQSLNIKYFFNHWKMKTHFSRCSKLLERRTGINIRKSSDRNFVSLKERILNLSSPMSKSMKEHLLSIPRNKMGLSVKEQILYDRIFNDEWYLIHRTTKTVLEKIQKNQGKELLSLEELHLRNEPAYTYMWSIAQILDSVFFSLSIGEPLSGYGSYFGEAEIRINLNKVDVSSLQGLFVSGVYHRFSPSGAGKKIVLYGTKYYDVHREIPTSAGYEIERQYCFELPSGEIVKESVGKSDEIFDFSVMRKALTLRIIERLRQLGLIAWNKIYENIETGSALELQELTRNIFNIDVLEAHVPRSFNISQPAVEINLDVENVLKVDQETSQKIIEAAYKGNIEFLASFSVNQLEIHHGVLEEHTVDVFSAAILGGQLKTVDFLLTRGFNLSSDLDILNMDYVKMLATLVGFPGLNIFTEKLLCPGHSVEERQQLGNTILKKILSVEKRNLINLNISYLTFILPEHLGQTEENLLSLTKASSEFYETLLKYGYESRLNGSDVDYTFIFEGSDPITGKHWFLLENGKENLKPCVFAPRSNKNALQALDVLVNVNKYASELDLARRVAYGYYAIPPSCIQKVQLTRVGDIRNSFYHNRTTIHIYMEDPTQNARLMKEFSDHIVFKEAIQIEREIAQNTNLDKKPKQLVMSYLFPAFKLGKEIQYPSVPEVEESGAPYPICEIGGSSSTNGPSTFTYLMPDDSHKVFHESQILGPRAVSVSSGDCEKRGSEQTMLQLDASEKGPVGSESENATVLSQWEKWQKDYNEKYPNRGAQGYGPGALTLYKNK